MPGSVKQSAPLARNTPHRRRTFETPVLRCKDKDSFFGRLSSAVAPMKIFDVDVQDSNCRSKKSSFPRRRESIFS
jgi:hypothetical protein